jgi:hypothetical protein
MAQKQERAEGGTPEFGEIQQNDYRCRKRQN